MDGFFRAIQSEFNHGTHRTHGMGEIQEKPDSGSQDILPASWTQMNTDQV